ncbi:MAG: glycosyltransferase family 39 protein [Kiritimatiellae bacterium]|nr:glycosyltransferase family 39 protein [Kiritimatiellia bacterium]
MKTPILLLPLLILYVAAVLWVPPSIVANAGDEARCIQGARNLLDGHYSPCDDVVLPAGPGYPIVLAPFIGLGVPSIVPRLLNALLLVVGIGFFHGTLRLYVGKRVALLSTYLLGLYPPFFKIVPLILTESLAVLLVCGAGFHFCRMHERMRSRRSYVGDLLAASFLLGCLILTKVMFAYVVTVLLLLGGGLCFRRTYAFLRKPVLVPLGALLLCVPYLAYTHSITGKHFYWSTESGRALYWSTSPHAGDMGQLFQDSRVAGNPALRANHGAFLDGLSGLSKLEQDREYRRQALRNLRQHPELFLRNVLHHAGRLLFNYPCPYTPQKASTYFWLLPNVFIVVTFVALMVPGYLARRRIPSEIRLLLLFALVAFGGHCLVHSEARYLLPLVPILILAEVFVAARTLKVELRA